MRHLNKVIFINSANIPYAEVSLDGNVHFAGTQGVGKSTVLRAILFFYTADKMRLGIQQGQKPFEDFYFPNMNSYIIYEVKTEHSRYAIMLSRSKGKLIFRFIDAPFCKEWFIGPEGRVESNWSRIREHIGNDIDISAKIEVYEQYRNIIFGNYHDRNRIYAKYAIVESSRYQNIPRSIQNVFLNSKLDADFVKNTIIQSMTDIEDSINLSAYRPQVSKFESNLEEIGCWYKKEPNGEIIIRKKADKAIDLYMLLIAIENEILNIWHRLNHSVNHSREQIPFIQDEIDSLERKRDIVTEKLEKNQSEYNKEHDELTGKIGECNALIKLIRNKKKKYEQIDIQSIISLVSLEPNLKKDKERQETLLKSLEVENSDIVEKYRKIREIIDHDFTIFKQDQRETLQSLRDQQQKKRDDLAARRDRRKHELGQSYLEWLAESDSRRDSIISEINKIDKKLNELKYSHPKSKEIESVEDDIRELRKQQDEYDSLLAKTSNEVESLHKEVKNILDGIEKEYELSKETIQNEIDRLEADIKENQAILERWDGSLYQWLTDNKPGWENNIGKLVDEQNVLYATGLSPVLSDETGFFGMDINLDAIENHHRTPDEYQRLIDRQNESIVDKTKELTKLSEDHSTKLYDINKEYRNKISEKKQQESNLKLQISLLTNRIKDAETRLRTLRHEETDMIDEERQKLTTEYDKAILLRDSEDSERNRQRKMQAKDIKKVDNEYNAALNEINTHLESVSKKQEAELADKIKKIEEHRTVVNKQEYDELSGKGADLNAIETCRRRIEEINQTLKKIDRQKEIVISYRKDEVEHFSHEAELKDKKQSLLTKDASVSKRYEEKRKKLESDRSDTLKSLDNKRKQFETITEGLKQYDSLCNIESIVPESLLSDDQEEKNSSAISDLVVQLRGTVNKKRSKFDELKRAVNSFCSHLSANNIFKFDIPHDDAEYMPFAIILNEFVEENKIELYRTRLSDLYSDILGSISREVGMLMNHTSEIRRIINDVNNDFRERNFAGVIRSIELRAEESSDRMMQLLRSIHEFTQENSLSLGENNLFAECDQDGINSKVIDYLRRFMNQLQKENSRTELTLSDTFTLKFRIRENDNDTGWVERISNVGSDGTDILVKAMVNIMLINVFKQKASQKNGDFIIHCMMDEIGKLHPSNVAGILQFANIRNIYLINSSPMGYNADIYRYNYLLVKDSKSRTLIKRLVTINL